MLLVLKGKVLSIEKNATRAGPPSPWLPLVESTIDGECLESTGYADTCTNVFSSLLPIQYTAITIVKLLTLP